MPHNLPNGNYFVKCQYKMKITINIQYFSYCYSWRVSKSTFNLITFEWQLVFVPIQLAISYIEASIETLASCVIVVSKLAHSEVRSQFLITLSF